jgi:hypothetical protein
VTEPEQALDRARAAVAEMRAAGAYPPEEARPEADPPVMPISAQLLEWAVIEPDLRDVRSTRRLGAPITVLKRGLLRLLAQYHVQLIAEQSRFNINLLRYVRQLEERVAELEDRANADRREE